jgi:hypothetical protein
VAARPRSRFSLRYSISAARLDHLKLPFQYLVESLIALRFSRFVVKAGMSSAFLPFALAFDHLLSNAFLFPPQEKTRIRVGVESILICPAQLFQPIPNALQGSSSRRQMCTQFTLVIGSVGCCKFFRFPFPSTMYGTMMTSNSCPARVCRKPINAELDSLMLAPVVVY